MRSTAQIAVEPHSETIYQVSSKSKQEFLDQSVDSSKGGGRVGGEETQGNMRTKTPNCI